MFLPGYGSVWLQNVPGILHSPYDMEPSSGILPADISGMDGGEDSQQLGTVEGDKLHDDPNDDPNEEKH